MALAISSRVASFTSDAHNRVTGAPSQRLRDNCILRPTDGLLKLSELPSVTNHVENSRKKIYHVKCFSTEENAKPSSSNKTHHNYRIADSESRSLHLQDDRLVHPSKHSDLSAPWVKRNEGGNKAGTAVKRGSPKVNRRAAMFASMAAFGVAGSCSCCNAALAAEWSYGGPSGPSKWPGACAIGTKQSPIDVPIKKAQHGQASGELQFDYKPSTVTFENTGHGTMQVNFPAGVNKLRLSGRELNLVQFHFHAPSEHAFDGLRFPMEAHLVHQDAKTKAIAVVGVMLDAIPRDKPNGALLAALQYSPMEHGKTVTVPNVTVSASDLLPSKASKNDLRYVQYFGSLTTPPCSEPVDWILLEKPLRVSTTEVVEFMKFVGDDQTLALNARPIQPLGDRQIFEWP